MPTIDGFVALPDDSGNAGKLVRAKIRVVGSLNVYEHVYQLNDPINDNPARVLTGDAAVTDAGVVVRLAPSANTIGNVNIAEAGSPDLSEIKELLLMQLFELQKISSALGVGDDSGLKLVS